MIAARASGAYKLPSALSGDLAGSDSDIYSRSDSGSAVFGAGMYNVGLVPMSTESSQNDIDGSNDKLFRRTSMAS